MVPCSCGEAEQTDASELSGSGGSVVCCEEMRLQNEDRYQALDNLEQFLHHHGDALVAQQTADGLEVRRAHKVPVGAVYVGVGDVEGLQEERKTA